MKAQLGEKLKDDLLLTSISNIVLGDSQTTTHLNERKQQRAITDDMIRVCLLYGKREWIHGPVYTITDRALEPTPYYCFIDRLRGLRVVCKQPDVEGNPIEVHTAYWVFDIKKRKPNLKHKRMMAA